MARCAHACTDRIVPLPASACIRKKKITMRRRVPEMNQVFLASPYQNCDASARWWQSRRRHRSRPSHSSLSERTEGRAPPEQTDQGQKSEDRGQTTDNTRQRTETEDRVRTD